MQKVILALAAAWFVINQLQKKAVDQFAYRFSGLKLDSFNGVRIIPTFGIYNSTALPVTVKTAGLAIIYNNSTIASFTGQVNKQLKPNAFTDITLPFTIKAIGSILELTRLINKSADTKTGWSIKGSISTNLGTYPVEIAMA